MSFVYTLNLLIACGLAVSGFYVSYVIHESGIVRSGWFTALRIILASVAITAVSNFLVMAVSGTEVIFPVQTSFNLAILCFFVWMILYYIRIIVARKTSLTSAKIVDFFLEEHNAKIVEGRCRGSIQ